MLQPKTTKKAVKKYVPTAKEKKNLEDATTGNGINSRPVFTKKEMADKKKMTGMKFGGKISKAKNGKSFPDLNKDGKITKADILKGRGVIAKKGVKMAKCKTGCN
jgi:hypothetical protein